MVTFARLGDRRRVWKKRSPVADEDGSVIRIQADLPKKLRENTAIMYRIQKAATGMANYKTAAVKNFQVILHGKEYSPQQLEQLPIPLRPSILSAPRSDKALAFFSKYTMLSNHFAADFKIKGLRFHSVEQYLAFRRAQVSRQEFYIRKALRAKTPVEAKSVLNALKQDHIQEWDGQVQTIAEEGVRAKFQQNEKLQKYLIDTGNLQLGEASTNPRWGIGLNLEDPNVLDTTKWSTTGNLLGKTLMKIRTELAQEQNNIQEPE